MFGDEVNTPLPALELETIRIPQPQLLAWEKELLGTYISEHPFTGAARVLSRHTTHQCAEVTAELAGQDAIIAGLVVGIRPLTTKTGKAFAAVTIEDLSGQTEVTIWSEAYERMKQAGILLDGNILLLKVNVRPRGERVSAGVMESCAYDQEAGRLVNFDASRFQPRSSGRPAWQSRGIAEAPQTYRPNGGGPGGPPRGGPAGPTGGPGGRDRSHLSVVAPATEPISTAPEPAVRDTGPQRLMVELEETTDEAADLRRLRRLCALLDEFAGDLPVELRVTTRGGQVVALQRAGVDPEALERIVSRARPLLGVLGQVREAGAPAERDLAAVGG